MCSTIDDLYEPVIHSYEIDKRVYVDFNDLLLYSKHYDSKFYYKILKKLGHLVNAKNLKNNEKTV